MFGGSASRAASIRAEARGFTPQEQTFLDREMDVGGYVICLRRKTVDCVCVICL